MKAFVAGASGFVGRVVCDELLARGHEVTALVRRPGSEPAPRFPSARQGVPDAVVHLPT